jgi:KEOPS complex subunit Pcc1
MKMTSESVFVTENAEAIYRCILPELGTMVSERSIVDVKVMGDSLVMNITADDIISMRSTLNTWLRLIQIAHDVCAVGKNAINGV